MCGRFALFSPLDLLKAQFDVEAVICDAHPSYNITPSQDILTIVRKGGLRLGKLRWGLVPPWLKDKSRGMINARTETLAEKPSFRRALTHKRCVIPADGYYEWGVSEGKKVPYYLYAPSQEPFVFAGIWESFVDGEGDRHSSCAIITREAGGGLREIHSRMPVILDREGIHGWLDTEITQDSRLLGILDNHSIRELSFHRVTEKMNNASFNEPSCIERVEC